MLQSVRTTDLGQYGKGEGGIHEEDGCPKIMRESGRRKAAVLGDFGVGVLICVIGKDTSQGTAEACLVEVKLVSDGMYAFI